MGIDKAIQNALRDLQTSEELRRQADAIHYRAKKRLEGLCSPAVPLLDDIKIKVVISKRMKNALRKSA